MLCFLIRIASSRRFLLAHTTYHFQHKKENQPKSSQICSYETFSKGLKNEFERAVVNEPSVFEPLKFYCILKYTHTSSAETENKIKEKKMNSFVLAEIDV